MLTYADVKKGGPSDYSGGLAEHRHESEFSSFSSSFFLVLMYKIKNKKKVARVTTVGDWLNRDMSQVLYMYRHELSENPHSCLCSYEERHESGAIYVSS